MKLPADYVTNPSTEKVHMTFEVLREDARTLCGLLVNSTWDWGDETLSGVAATCQRCQSLFKKAS